MTGRKKLEPRCFETVINSAMGHAAEVFMIWLAGVLGYVLLVISIVKFFQFVSVTDRTIEQFWVQGNGIKRGSGARKMQRRGQRNGERNGPSSVLGLRQPTERSTAKST